MYKNIPRIALWGQNVFFFHFFHIQFEIYRGPYLVPTRYPFHVKCRTHKLTGFILGSFRFIEIFESDPLYFELDELPTLSNTWCILFIKKAGYELGKIGIGKIDMEG